MKKWSWILSGTGAILILSSFLYPLHIISKTAFLILLLGGAGIMFIGSMVRSFSLWKKQ